MEEKRIMNEYNSSEAYDLSLFDVPAIELPEEEPQEQQKPVKEKKQEPKPLLSLNRKTYDLALHALRVFAIASVLLLLFAGILRTRIELETLDKENAKLESLIEDAESENTRLRMQLSSTISREKVENYATSVLGMHKLERYQIHYFDERAEDEVVLAGGKAPAVQSEKAD